MHKTILLLIVCAMLSGCATSKDKVGSKTWYNNRIAEIESAYQKKEITQAEYLKLKNDLDAIMADNRYSGGSNSHAHFGYGYGSGGGSAVGIGVGF